MIGTPPIPNLSELAKMARISELRIPGLGSLVLTIAAFSV